MAKKSLIVKANKKQKFKVGDLVRKEFYGDDQPSHGLITDVSMNCLVGGHRVKVQWIDRPWNRLNDCGAKELKVISAI